MTSLIGMNILAYEMINLALWALSLGVTVIFLRYLLAEIYRRGWSLRMVVEPMMRHEMAIALIGMTLGEAGIRGWTWYARVADRLGWPDAWMKTATASLVPLAFALIQIAGLLCVVRVFSPNEWGHRTWMTLGALVVLLQVVFYLL